MIKKQLRNIYKTKRLSLTVQERAKLDDLLLIRFQQVLLPQVSTLLNFWPLTQLAECNTFPCVEFLEYRMPGLQLAYPKTDWESGEMKAVRVHETTVFRENEYGIPEPEEGDLIPPEQLDLIFVPLLIFDRQGNRVGYGKGFYDRFLRNCRESSIKLGFSYFEPVERIEDAAEFDVPLTIGITPNSIYEF